METKQHENWQELAEFAHDVFRAFNDSTSPIKDPLGVKMKAPQAFQQFIAEVNGYGYGISNMSAETWFNNDLPMRQGWAAEIAEVHRAYKAAVAAEEQGEAAVNSLETEVKKLSEGLNSVLDKIGELSEQMSQAMMDKMSPEDKAKYDAMSDEEKAAMEKKMADEESADKEE